MPKSQRFVTPAATLDFFRNFFGILKPEQAVQRYGERTVYGVGVFLTPAVNGHGVVLRIKNPKGSPADVIIFTIMYSCTQRRGFGGGLTIPAQADLATPLGHGSPLRPDGPVSEVIASTDDNQVGVAGRTPMGYTDVAKYIPVNFTLPPDSNFDMWFLVGNLTTDNMALYTEWYETPTVVL